MCPKLEQLIYDVETPGDHRKSGDGLNRTGDIRGQRMRGPCVDHRLRLFGEPTARPGTSKAPPGSNEPSSRTRSGSAMPEQGPRPRPLRPPWSKSGNQMLQEAAGSCRTLLKAGGSCRCPPLPEAYSQLPDAYSKLPEVCAQRYASRCTHGDLLARL